MRNVSDKCCKETQNTHFMFINFFWGGGWKEVLSYCLLDNVEKYRLARRATDGNMAHAPCMLDA